MTKKKKQKLWNSEWWKIILIIILIFYFFNLLTSNFFKTNNEKAEDYLIERDYENVNVRYYGGIASVEMEHYKRPPSRHVSTGLHPLHKYWKNATYYSLKIETKGEICSYLIDAQNYRIWREEIIGVDYETWSKEIDSGAWIKWKNDVSETEECY